MRRVDSMPVYLGMKALHQVAIRQPNAQASNCAHLRFLIRSRSRFSISLSLPLLFSFFHHIRCDIITFDRFWYTTSWFSRSQNFENGLLSHLLLYPFYNAGMKDSLSRSQILQQVLDLRCIKGEIFGIYISVVPA